MINGLTNMEKFKVIRKLYNASYDANNFPIIKKDDFDFNDLEKIKICNFKNIKKQKCRESSLVTMFNYDYELEKLWQNPFRYLTKLLGFYAICTPDYSVYANMNYNDIRFNIYRNRWYGSFLQEKGFKVVPSISWALEDTYDLCFSGVEKGSIVIVSTLGACSNWNNFINGFNKMKDIINPSLIIIFGKYINGITGKLLCFEYTDSFLDTNDTVSGNNKLFNVSRIVEMGRSELSGW